MKNTFAITLAIAASLIACAAGARDYQLSTLAIEQPFARATPPAAEVGGAYMTIDNKGAAADRLVRVSSPAAGQVQIHSMAMDGNVMRMHEIAGLDLPAGKSVALKPGGLHLMMLGLRHPLTEGSRIPMTLTFEHAGTIDIEVVVQSMTADMHGMH